MSYNVTMYGFCGMMIPVARDVDYHEAQREAKKIRDRHIRRYSKDEISIMNPTKWELTDDGSGLIGDYCGILEIEKHAQESVPFEE